MIQVNRFVTPKTSRFAQIGELSSSTRELVFALHGYGQLASDFAKVVSPIASEGRVIICPEALSRFYTHHRSRTVGATWMTSEDREYEIMDYVTYLGGLASALVEETSEEVSVTVLGFSQGCPTASRWVGNGHLKPQMVILWGSGPAHDLSDEEWDALADVPEILLVAGSNDNFLPEDRIISAEEDLRDHQCSYRTIRYDGGHELNAELLTTLFD